METYTIPCLHCNNSLKKKVLPLPQIQILILPIWNEGHFSYTHSNGYIRQLVIYFEKTLSQVFCRYIPSRECCVAQR